MESDEIWSGGTTDTVHFKQGIAGRKLTASDGTSVSASTTVLANLSGESASTGYIDQWAYVADTTALASSPALKVTLDTTAGSFNSNVAKSNLNNGWNLLHIAKTSFSGSGAWAGVVGVRNTAYSVSGQTAAVTFDDLRAVGLKRVVETAQYDELSRLASKTDAKGNTVGFEYDAAGNKVREIDTKGKDTEYGYDSMNRETSSTDAGGSTTLKGYDLVGNLVSTTDAMGNSNHHIASVA